MFGNTIGASCLGHSADRDEALRSSLWKSLPTRNPVETKAFRDATRVGSGTCSLRSVITPKGSR